MIAETYVTYLANGQTEFGYTFKLEAGAEDTEFDIPLGVVDPEKQTEAEINTFIDNEWERFKPTAEKIASAL